jgi:hypothetical protein
MVDDDLEDAPEPILPDPMRGLRHLFSAILLQACLDSRFWNANLRRDALLFLLPRDDRFREHLQICLELSGVNQKSFRAWLNQFW